jgi:hypothetical protein
MGQYIFSGTLKLQAFFIFSFFHLFFFSSFLFEEIKRTVYDNMRRHLSCPAYQAPGAEREEDGFVLLGETLSERNDVRPGTHPDPEDLPPSYEV